tara:strand:- start:1453 stop:1869 length:417 start_codon:yes stop_codon:yes gene_type:complete
MIEVNGYEELNKILWENKDTDNIMMLYFGTSWCGPCQKLKEKMKEQKNEIEKVIVLYLDCDGEENEQIVDDWKIESLPTQIFVHIESQNVVKDERIEGYDWIKLVMTYKEIVEKNFNNKIEKNSDLAEDIDEYVEDKD